MTQPNYDDPDREVSPSALEKQIRQRFCTRPYFLGIRVRTAEQNRSDFPDRITLSPSYLEAEANGKTLLPRAELVTHLKATNPFSSGSSSPRA